MKIVIEGNGKEIAALITGIQEQQNTFIPEDSNGPHQREASEENISLMYFHSSSDNQP